MNVELKEHTEELEEVHFNPDDQKIMYKDELLKIYR